MENKIKFEEGQKAWSIQLGHGYVTRLDWEAWPYVVSFMNEEESDCLNYTESGKMTATDAYPSLFHREQDLDLRKADPPIGSWGYFWDNDEVPACFYGQLAVINSNNSYGMDKHTEWRNFSVDIPQHILDSQSKKK